MLEQAMEIAPKIIEWRRQFHMYPELGFEEYQTSAKVAQVLTELGYRVRTGVGRTGVIGERGQGKPVIAIRADMDALPIQETNQVPYASQVPGKMHACGHDAHTAIVLGVAMLLANEDLSGTVRLLFQPAEEVADEENKSGAPRMIEDGAMENVDTVLALHVDAHTAVGDIRIGSGPSSGGVDNFTATIIGKGGHGARPHEAVDPIWIAAHVIFALNGIISRRTDPFAPAVVSIGSIHGGEAENVIPDEVRISGTIRYMDSQVQQQIHQEIEKALSVARLFGGDYQLKIDISDPPMINDEQVVRFLEQVAGDLLGKEHVLPPKRGLGAEDFGQFSKLAPGAMFGLGCLIEGDERNHHNPRFDIDERCLPIGAAILAESAVRFLRKGGL
jgi:amidohydrolase